MDKFPGETPDGLPGTNFGSKSGSYFAGSNLLSAASIGEDILTCQNIHKKKILFSLGGTTSEHLLNGVAEGERTADLVWDIFGPRPESSDNPRAFDVGDQSVEVDGFDFDIEHPSLGKGINHPSSNLLLTRS